MFSILFFVVPIILVLGQPERAEDNLSNSEMKFLAIAQCEAIYNYMCPSGLCSVSAMNQTAKFDYDWRPAEHFCDASCMRDAGCRTICNCADQRFTMVDPYPDRFEQQVLSDPVLHCREPSFMSVKWNYSGKEEFVVFALEIRDYGDLYWKPYNLTLKNITLVRGLSPRQKYLFRVFAVGPSGVIGRPTVSELISTLPPVSEFESESIDLDSPSNLQLSAPIQYTAEGASARVVWESGNHKTCSYQLRMFGDKTPSGQLLPFQFNVAETPVEMELELSFDDTYYLTMDSRLDGSEVLSTRYAEMPPLVIKDCLSALNNNLTICVPPAPTDLNLEVVGIDSNTAQVSLSWTEVEGHPTGYNVSLYDLNDKLMKYMLVPGTATVANFHDVTLQTYYKAQVRAFAPSGLGAIAGKSKKLGISEVNKSPGSLPSSLEPFAVNNTSKTSLSETVTKPTVHLMKAGSHSDFFIYIAIGVSLAVCMFGLLSFALLRRRKLPKIPEVSQSCAMVRSEPTSGPEQEPEDEKGPGLDLQLHNRIGEGAFGTVWSGYLREPSKDPIEVAVKMLKENPSREDSVSFDKEMDILKSVNRHPNVIKIIACVTEGPQKRIVMEYCKLGDLQRFLNTAWIELTKRPSENTDIERRTYQNFLVSANNTYEIFLGIDTETFSVLLVSFARQIASGMEFLTESGIVHRDLAARNILIARDGTIRISDFGLSREVLDSSVYTKRGYERVPYKWVAPEAIQNKVFSSRSDVWSYGITLWEIVTLGSSPYAFINDPSSYLNYLLSGHRIPQPRNCSSDLYTWMQRCWEKDPESRPTFQVLREHMENLERTGRPYVSLERHLISDFSSMRPIQYGDSGNAAENDEVVDVQ